MAAILGLLALLLASSPLPDRASADGLQLTVACPNTGELVIDKIKICYFTCPDVRTSIRIGADEICPPFH